MKRETLFLKIVVLLLAVPVIASCIAMLPILFKDAADLEWELAYLRYPLLAIFYVSTIPYFMALFQAFRLLGYIDKDTAFSELSITALNRIKYCAATISVLYMLAMPMFYMIGEQDDAPGVIVIGLVLVFAPIVIAVFAAVLQKLLKNAIALKTENDLTV